MGANPLTILQARKHRVEEVDTHGRVKIIALCDTATRALALVDCLTALRAAVEWDANLPGDMRDPRDAPRWAREAADALGRLA